MKLQIEKIRQVLTESNDKQTEACCDNLNCEQVRLPQNRKAVVDYINRKILQKKQNGMCTVAWLQKVRRIYTEPDEQGKKKEYAGIAIYFLDRYIQKAPYCSKNN